MFVGVALWKKRAKAERQIRDCVWVRMPLVAGGNGGFAERKGFSRFLRKQSFALVLMLFLLVRSYVLSLF